MIETEDLIQPAGPLVKAMFPDEDDDAFEERLQSYLDQGYENLAGVTDVEALDRGARAWALYRGFDDAMTLFTTKPSSASLQGLGSVGFSANAIAEWGKKANQYLAIYNAEVPADVGLPDAIPSSSYTRNRYIW